MKILMATGGSAHSEVALNFGAYILHTSRTRIIPTVVTVARHEADRLKAEAILARSCQLLELDCLQVRTRIRVGHPAEEIIREAEEGNYDVVIVGERQHHDLKT